MEVVKSLGYFVIAGLFEIGGGYLIWLWLREGKDLWYGILGAFVLILYGIVPTCSLLTLGVFMLLMAAYLSFFPFSGAGRSITYYPTGLT